MKVLMFQDYFSFGGIEKVILDIKKNLIDYEMNVLSMVNKSNENVISLLNKDYNTFCMRNIKGLHKYREFLKKNKYDIIHIHCYNAFGLIYAYIAKKYCKNIIIHAHSSNIDKDFFGIKHLLNVIIKIILSRNKYQYVAVSEECNRFCFNNKKAFIIPNGVDYSSYYFNRDERIKYRKEFHINNDEILIGHIGRFNKHKNHEFIIDIFNEISKMNNNYKLMLVGEGRLKNKIINKVDEFGLNDKVIFLNNRDDIPKLINAFDVFLFPSIIEGFPLSVIENQINEKYVFASDILPRDVQVSNRLEFISLEKDCRYWAEKIMNLQTNSFKLDKRLDIAIFIKKIKNIYRGFNEEN